MLLKLDAASDKHALKAGANKNNLGISAIKVNLYEIVCYNGQRRAELNFEIMGTETCDLLCIYFLYMRLSQRQFRSHRNKICFSSLSISAICYTIST